MRNQAAVTSLLSLSSNISSHLFHLHFWSLCCIKKLNFFPFPVFPDLLEETGLGAPFHVSVVYPSTPWLYHCPQRFVTSFLDCFYPQNSKLDFSQIMKLDQFMNASSHSMRVAPFSHSHLKNLGIKFHFWKHLHLVAS